VKTSERKFQKVLTRDWIHPYFSTRMKKAKRRPLNIPEKGINPSQLPWVVPRKLAAEFCLVTTRTLRRYELQGLLEPVRRNQRVIGYKKQALLDFVSAK
jgi:hypothetical protein